MWCHYCHGGERARARERARERDGEVQPGNEKDRGEQGCSNIRRIAA